MAEGWHHRPGTGIGGSRSPELNLLMASQLSIRTIRDKRIGDAVEFRGSSDSLGDDRWIVGGLQNGLE